MLRRLNENEILGLMYEKDNKSMCKLWAGLILVTRHMRNQFPPWLTVHRISKSDFPIKILQNDSSISLQHFILWISFQELATLKRTKKQHTPHLNLSHTLYGKPFI